MYQGLWQYDELLPGSCFLHQEVLPDAVLGLPSVHSHCGLDGTWAPPVPGLLNDLPLSGPLSPHLADKETG